MWPWSVYSCDSARQWNHTEKSSLQGGETEAAHNDLSLVSELWNQDNYKSTFKVIYSVDKPNLVYCCPTKKSYQSHLHR